MKMIEQDRPQQNLKDAEILNDKKVIVSENEEKNTTLSEKADNEEKSGTGTQIGGSEPICGQNIKSEQTMPVKSSKSEEKILEQIQILKNELAESSKREEQLSQLINEQNEMFKTRLLYDEGKEKLIDKMHDELQALKSNLYKNFVKPVLIDVLQIRDNIRRMETDLNKKFPEGLMPIKIFSGYSLDLADLLEAHDVEIFEEKPGTSFIPLKQKVINRLATNNKDLSGTIVRSKSSGYIYNGQVISSQKVDVYYFDESITHSADPGNETTQTD